MRRSAYALTWMLAVAALTAPAPACAQSALPNVYRSLESGKPARDAGEINGRIASIDYPAGQLSVRTSRHTVTVAVVPSTSIELHGQYATLADLRRGQSVRISAYEVGGRLVAQTIRI